MKKLYPLIASILVVAILNQIILPNVIFASTGGPNSPEFAGFEPVGTQNMVNNFTGAFSYNMPVIEIPGPDGGSYALSLSYHSGNSPDQEASWVGYGWTLSPGSISRSIRGFADDANGAEVTHYNQVPANWTAGIGATYGLNGLEIFGVDIPLNLSITSQLQFNNYKGFSIITTPYVGFTLGMYSLGYTFEEGNKGSWNYSINPGAILSKALQDNSKTENESKTQSEKNSKAKSLKENYNYRFNKTLGNSQFISSSYNTYTRPTATTSYTGVSARFSLSGQPDVSFLPVGSAVASVFGTFTMQSPVTEETLKHYGYLYSANAETDDMMDYTDEMDSPFNKRNYFLSIPTSLSDIYSVSGEGIGGSFSFHSRYAGHFHPNHKKSETFSGQLGLELQAGLNIGPGGDIGGSYNSLEVEGYGDDDYAFQNSGDEPFYAAFSGDPAVNVDFGSETAVQASADQTNSIPGLMEYQFKVSDQINKTANGEDRVSRSSFIVSHTNSQMLEADVSGSRYYNNYTRDDSTSQWIDRSDSYISDGIGEFATYNNDGLRYNYGLPVYSRNEMSLQFGVKSTDSKVTLQHNYIAYKSDIDTDGALKKVGTEDHNVYASDYLLTEITTPDYIDRTWDGPSSDDFGGYVKFNYNQYLGNNAGSKSGGNWYQWRVPYSGLIYNKGQLSDLNDDMGNVSMGQREVYYLSTVETKTNIAAFYTSDRNDGLEAKQASTSTESAFFDAIKSDYFSSYSSSADKLQKLDSIYLYARNTDGSRGEVVKRVYFKYDYSSWPGQPNTISSADGSGKLTLKYWWTEDRDVRNARISPFQCVYTYPSGKYPAKYTLIDKYGSGKNESPSFTNFLSDRWGAYQENGESRYDNMMAWNDQKTNSSFDPAAYQLKQIILPSKGEIHIQYEQNDYRYVQDRIANVMAPLKKVSSEITGSAGDVYYLNLDSLGLTSSQYQDVVDLIQQEYINKGEKIYFKFLYALQNSDIPDVNSCNSEYISGYVNVEQVGKDGSGVYVKLGTSDEDQYTNPREVCLNYYYANHNGFEVDACSMKEFDISEAESLLYELLEELSDPFEISGDNECLSVNETYSYLRIPIVNNKLGGGIRVKRLLTYDKGIEGDTVLYGKEYVYQNEEGLSSGVALNEPETGGEENALRTYLKAATDQDWVERAISGEDKDQTEGPLGKNILPGASIGYSRIVTKNIFDGINNSGFSVDQYYTAKDYPFDGTWSYKDENGTTKYIKGLDYTSISQKQDWLPIYAILVNTFVSNLWLTQGYAFSQNNMHGQPKSSATYLGDYDYINSPDKTQLMALKETDYYQPGEPVKVMDAWNNIEKRTLGKEMEVVFESRSIKDQTTDASAEFDVTIGIIVVPPFTIPYITVIPSLSYIEQELYTHVTNTINSYTALPKSVRTYHDGVYTIAENEIFDATTAAPLITKTTDDFNGLILGSSSSKQEGYYFNYSFPAAQQHDEMSKKSIGDGFVVNTADYDDLVITYEYLGGEYVLLFQGDICSFADKFAPGDFLAIDFASSGTYFFQSAGLNGTTMTLYPVEGFTTTYTNDGVSALTIVRSGRTNQLSQSVGTITTYGNEKTDDNNFANYKSVKSVDQNYIDEWNKRQTFASNLTTQLNSGSTGVKRYNDPNVHITNSGTGSCDPMNIQVQFLHQGDTLVKMSVNDNCIEYIVPGGNFSMDSACGKLIYYSPGAECSPTTIECILFCPGIYPNERMPDVITASATGLDEDWELDADIASIFNIDMSSVDNPYAIAENGKWREKTSNSYREDITAITDADGRVFNSGIFRDSLTLYNHQYDEANNDTFWMPINTTTKYSPYGTGIEQENIIGIKSITKKGYGYTVPYLTAANSAYQSSQFESFEYTSNDGSYITCEDGFKISEYAADYGAGQFGAIVDSTAHAGSHSYLLGMESVSGTTKIPNGFGGFFNITLFSHDSTELSLQTIPLDDKVKENGLSVKLWLKVGNSDDDPSGMNLYIENTSIPLHSKTVSFEKISRVGEWTLYEATTSKFNGNWQESINPIFQLKHETPDVEIYVDDIRIQPTNAQMTAYVYDPANLKILTMFDDQHFGIYYQYNIEGKLVRKIRETERGLKTVQETQYNVIKQDRQ